MKIVVPMKPKIARRKLHKNSSNTPYNYDDGKSCQEHIKILTEEKESIFSMMFQRDTLIANLREQINALKITIHKQQLINGKLKLTKKKLFDLQNQNIKLRNDYKLAEKFMHQEIGENISLTQLTDPKSTWRGRAQQVLSLQQRVNELKAVIGDQPKFENEQIKLLQQQQRKIDVDRKSELEEIKKMLSERIVECEEYKQKCYAQKLRNNNLSDELNELKLKITKSDEDKYKVVLQLRASEERLQSAAEKCENKIADLLNQLELKSQKIERLVKSNQEAFNTVENKEATIKDLRSKIEHLEKTIDTLEKDLKLSAGEFLFKCRSLNKNEYMAVLDLLQYEKENLVQQINNINDRLEKEREQVYNLQEQLKKQKFKNNSLEHKYNEHLKDHQLLTERNKRSQRISNYVKSNACNNNSVNGTPSTLTIYTTKSMCSTNDLTENFEKEKFQLNLEITNLTNKLDLTNEHIKFLEENVQELQREKMLDAKFYQHIIYNSKDALVDSLSATGRNAIIE